MKPDLQLRRRLIVIDIIIPAMVIFSFLGGWPFCVFVAMVLTGASWELWQIFSRGGHAPSLWIMMLFTPIAVILRHLFEFQYSDIWLAALVIVAMGFHTLMQQKGAKAAATDFFITTGSVIYLGWLGSYAVSIRDLPHGLLWLLTVFPIISMADTGAYLFGRAFGKHKMLPVVSPKKSWEGYIGGIIVGALSGWGFAALWHIREPQVLPLYGLFLGIAISILAPWGDFGESMIKRQFNLKDTSNLLLDHGGLLDRADSSLWAAPIGYYLLSLLVG